MPYGPDPEKGFILKPTEIIEDEMIQAMEALGAEMHPDNPLYHFVVHVARQLGEEWEAIYENWRSGFIGLARGDQKNLLAEFLLEKKRAVQKARGWVRIWGTPHASYDARSVTVVAKNGQEFINIHPFKLNGSGYGDGMFEAVLPGKQGNIIPMSIVSWSGNNINSAQNISNHWNTLHLFSDFNQVQWRSLPVDAVGEFYQEIRTVDLDAPGGVRDFTVWMKAQGNVPVKARVQIVLFSADGEPIGGTEEVTVEVAPQGKPISFIGHDFNVSMYERIRVSPAVLETEGPVMIGVVPSGQGYSGGLWHEFWLPVDFVMAGAITTCLDGEFYGGRDAEDDIDLDQRWEKILSTPGVGNPDSVETWLMRGRGVLDAMVRFNPYNTEWEGLPPKTIHAIVDGGQTDYIAQTLWRRGFGCRTYGSRHYPVLEPGGNAYHMVSFDRATVRLLAVQVIVSPTVSFVPSIDIPLIQEAIVRYIGGPDRSRTMAQGRRIGEGVSMEKIAAAALSIPNGDRKIEDVEVYVGDRGGILKQADLSIGPTERVRISMDDIEVTTGL